MLGVALLCSTPNSYVTKTTTFAIRLDSVIEMCPVSQMPGTV